jgi:hypothetical protein
LIRFDEYRHPIIDHLADIKVMHWERSLRELVSRAFYALTETEPKYMHDVILPKLLANTMSEDLFIRHGCILAVAEIALALTKCNYTIEPKRQQEIVSIVPDTEKNRGYRGKGGEIIRHAVCRLIENIAVSKIPLVRTPVTAPVSTTARPGKVDYIEIVLDIYCIRTSSYMISEREERSFRLSGHFGRKP